MGTLLDTFYTIDGGKIEIVYHGDNEKPYFIVVYPEVSSSEGRELLYFKQKKTVWQFCTAFVRAFNNLIDS